MRNILLTIAATLAVVSWVSAQFTVHLPTPIVAQNANGSLERIYTSMANPLNKRIERTALSSNGAMVAYGDRQGRVYVDRVSDGVNLLSATTMSVIVPWLGTPHEDYVNGSGPSIRGLAFIMSDTRICAITGSGTLHIFDIVNGDEEVSVLLASPVTVFDMHEASDRFVVGSDQGGIFEYALSNQSPIRQYRPEDGAGSVHTVRYSQNGTKLHTALSGYHLSDDIENDDGTGTKQDAGLTRWSTSSGAREHRYGAPEGSANVLIEPVGAMVLAGTDENAGALFDVNDLLLSEPTEITDAIALLDTSGSCLVAAARSEELWLHRFSGHVALKYTDYESNSYNVATSISASASGDYVSIGKQDGRVVVYHFATALGSISSVTASGTIGGAYNTQVDVSRVLLGHSAAVQEVAVAPTGNWIASRDANGQIIVWQRQAGGNFTGTQLGLTLPLAGKRERCLSFAFRELALFVVMANGKISRFPLPSLAPVTLVNPTLGGQAVPAIAALEVNTGKLVVAGIDSGLYVANPGTGIISTTLVPPPTSMMSAFPFTNLASLATGRTLFAAPATMKSATPGVHKPTLFRTSDWAVLGTTLQNYAAATFVNLGSTIAIANGYEAGGVANFASANLAGIAGNPSAARVGIAPLTSTLAIAADRLKLHLVQSTAAGFSNTPLTGVLGRVTSLGGSAASQRVYVGLESGSIVELTPTP